VFHWFAPVIVKSDAVADTQRASASSVLLVEIPVTQIVRPGWPTSFPHHAGTAAISTCVMASFLRRVNDKHMTVHVNAQTISKLTTENCGFLIVRSHRVAQLTEYRWIVRIN
jgi:hypothetical protein